LPIALSAAPSAQQPAPVEVGPWSLMGPFSHGAPAAFDERHPPEDQLAGMVAGEPWDPRAHPVQQHGLTLEWVEVAGADPRGEEPFDAGRFDLVALTEQQASSKQAAFLYCPIRADAPSTPTVLFGSDDGFAMWLNGELVARRGEMRGCNPFEERVTLDLVAGVNHLLVQVTNNGGAWVFEMQADRAVDRLAINTSVDRGVEFLLGRQLLDGSWEDKQNDYRNGATALALYTLLESGVAPDHPAVLRALEYLRTEPSGRTYTVGCELMALAALEDPTVLPWIEERADDLISWQQDNGTWAYPHGHWDLSCTQFAVLGLRAAASRGVRIPARVWETAVRGTLTSREPFDKRAEAPAVAFTYYPGHASGYTGSMTTAGIAVLAIAREQLGAKLRGKDRPRIDEAIDAGVRWLAREFTAATNPGRAGRAYLYYWLYGVERVGALLDLDRIGAHDWYAEGASYLVTGQNADGSWSTPWGDKDTSTCFSLLFLEKATASVTGRSRSAQRRHHETGPAADRVVLHAVEGDPLVTWVVPPAGAELREVRFFARRPGDEWIALGAGEGQRFSAQHSFDVPGRWELRAEAVCVDERRLESEVLPVNYETGIREWDLEYAGDSARNDMPVYAPTVTVSSTEGGNAGARLVDNAWWSYWTCAKTDTAPTIDIALRKKAKAKRLLLTHARSRKSEQDAHPRAKTIELWLNKDKQPTVHHLNTSASRKTTIELPPRTRLSKLRIRITAIEGGELGAAAVGFTEIELQ
jgi:hypothetical protein